MFYIFPTCVLATLSHYIGLAVKTHTLNKNYPGESNTQRYFNLTRQAVSSSELKDFTFGSFKMDWLNAVKQCVLFKIDNTQI